CWKKFSAATLICLLVSSAGIYYAFFSCFLILVTGLARGIETRRPSKMGPAALLIMVILLGILINVSPSLIYWVQEGTNPSPTANPFSDADLYGLKLAQLLLPISCHRLGFLAHWKAKYFHGSLLINENDASALGLVGALGFLILIGALLAWNSEPRSL